MINHYSCIYLFIDQLFYFHIYLCIYLHSYISWYMYPTFSNSLAYCCTFIFTHNSLKFQMYCYFYLGEILIYIKPNRNKTKTT